MELKLTEPLNLLVNTSKPPGKLIIKTSLPTVLKLERMSNNFLEVLDLLLKPLDTP
jgi:hypothetical protein